jgi:pimeloyl-CoA dehydrogenase
MNFELNEEQRALRDSLERMLAQRYGFEARRAFAASAAGHDAASWRQLAELGITALAVPEAHGGFGGGAVALLPVLQALGQALSLEPVLPCLLATAALRAGADAALQAELLPGLATGETRIAWAHDEDAGRHAALWVQTRARRTADGWCLDGAKANVLGASLAGQFIVSARVDGAPDEAAGCALFLVEAGAPGLALRPFRLVDDQCAGALQLAGTPARPLADPLDPQRGAAALQAVLALGIAATCADMVGAAQSAYRQALDYLNTRQQFGRAIGQNQALRHRAAEMLVALEMARSMAIAAAIAADRPQSEESTLDLHRAKLSVGRHARTVAHGAIQLHGGIGMTEECAVGHSLRRIHVMDQLFGDSEAHAARLATQLQAQDAAPAAS